MHEDFKKKLKELIRSIYEKELGEISTTGSGEAYSTPFAFKDIGKGYKKKKKKKIKEELERKDLSLIRKMIRDVIADVIRDIWIKRTSWK